MTNLERMVTEATLIRDKIDVETNPELFIGFTTKNYILRREEKQAQQTKEGFERLKFYCKSLGYV